MMKIIDSQIHLWKNLQAPARHHRAPFLIADALHQMKEAGVHAALNHPPKWDPGANEYAALAASEHPDKFATLDWFALDKHADESTLDECLEKPGVVGLRFVMATPDLAPDFAQHKFDWLWGIADRRRLPVTLFVAPQQLETLDEIAGRFPNMRLTLDHLAVLPFVRLPEAGAHFDRLVALAGHPNVAVKASGFPSMATDQYPFRSTHELLHRTFDAFGPERFFWGTDITRMRCSWRQMVTVFTEELDWLTGRDLELVMGAGLQQWIGWE